MKLETVLETERLRLTNWLPGHFNDLFRLHSDPEITRYMSGDGRPESRERARERLDGWAKLFAKQRMGKLRVIRKADGELVGRAGFGIYPPTDEPELGYALFRKHWGNGYAFEAASGLRDWIFRETDAPYFIGLADTRNAASLRILTGIGMRETHIDLEPSGLSCQFHIFTREDWNG